jgi:restriction system protein
MDMPIPDFQSLMLPMLTLAADGAEHSLADARGTFATQFALSDEERAELLPSGRQRRFDNRVAWAKVYLERAGLVSSPQRGQFVITEEGHRLLAEKPQRISIVMLERFERFRDFRSGSRKTDGPPSTTTQQEAASTTPEEQLELAYESIRKELISELLERVRAGSPRFFENLVIELLLKMGYGGNRAEAGRAIGGAGDEGIDGIINQDRLGLESIYIQAKRWQATVGRPEIQKFVGALHGQRARKGVFLTTGTFSAEARDYVGHIDPKVVLIDGAELAEYMVEFGLGVTTKTSYVVMRIDLEFFEEE